MQCSFPPSLTEEQLLAVLDGEMIPSIERHLAGCESCSTRLAELRQLTQGLKTTLKRWDCPTPDELADYHLGLLPNGGAVTTHLAGCSSCRTEIELLDTLLHTDTTLRHEPQSTASRLPRLGEIIAQLLPRQLSAVRGTETNKITAKADGITIFLEVESSPEGYILTGQVLADEQDIWEKALLELRQGDIFITTNILDDMGEFRCTMLPDGLASLRITSENGKTIVVNNIQLGPANPQPHI